MLVIFWLASKHTSNVCTLLPLPAHPAPTSDWAKKQRRKAKENKRVNSELKLNWNWIETAASAHTSRTMASSSALGQYPVMPGDGVGVGDLSAKKRRKKKTLSCYTHKTHPAKWQISMATRSGQLMSFRRQMFNEKNSPIRLSLLRNTWKYMEYVLCVCPMLPGFRSHSLSVNGLWVVNGATSQNSSGCCMQISHCGPSAVKASASASLASSLWHAARLGLGQVPVGMANEPAAPVKLVS